MTLGARAAVLAAAQMALAAGLGFSPDPLVRGWAAGFGMAGLLCLVLARQLSARTPSWGHLVATGSAVLLGFLALIGPILYLVDSKGLGDVPPLYWLVWVTALVGFALAAWLHHDLPRQPR